ncbi:MAG: hypothetical protein PHE61_08565 [Candidatus Omnitrophica bacterium]|nr:hypothetical protein [Candidatus Omnitrophota bacterium]
MDKEVVMAMVRRWQAELREMLTTLNGEKKGGPIVDALKKREKEIEDLIAAIQDQSFIPKGEVAFEPQPVMEEIDRKVRKVKAGVKKIKELHKEKKRILEDLAKE